MVALKTERRIFIWHVKPHATPSEAPVEITFEQIYDILKGAFDAKAAFTYLDSDGKIVGEDEGDIKNCIFIADMQKSKDGAACTILINRGDPDVAHPSFINPKALTVKNVPPGRDEVQGWSAHMTIATKPDSLGRHRACFEQMQGVSSTLVQRYFDGLLDKTTEASGQYQYEKVIKKNKKTATEMRRYKIRLGVNKVPSESLVKDIKQGVLSEIALIRTNPEYSGPGSPTIMNSVKERLTIRTKRVDDKSAMDYIKLVTDWGKDHGYNEVQIRVDELPGGTSSSPRFDLEKADAMDTLYSRSHRLTGFKTFLETCYQTIDKEISGKMTDELTNEDHW